MDIEKTMEFILNSQAKAEVQMAKIREAAAEAQARADERMTRIDQTLRRAIRVGVREARNARVRDRLLDEKITQLAAAQVVTEEKLQSFIESLRQGRNGGRGGTNQPLN